MKQLLKENKQKNIFFLAAIIVFQVIIYAPHVGNGFITDDFVWLDNTVINGKVDYLRPFTITTGFFRPLVGLSFALQYQLHHMNPKPYGWLNLLLHLVNILLIYLVLSSVEISRPYALWTTALFALNAKGPAMAVGWISGRTTLLFTFFMLLSLFLYLKAREHYPGKKWKVKRILQYFGVGLLYFAALLSKETAAALPVFVFLACFFVKKKSGQGFLKKAQSAFLDILVFLVPLLLYLVLRLNSNAMTPFDAPGFYRYTLDPLLILRNLLEYITRAGMLDIALILLLLPVLLFTRGKTKATAGIDPVVMIGGSAWFLCFLLPTLLIPSRSDIYVYVAQVGIHLLALAIIFYLWKRIGRTFVLVPIAVLVLAYTAQLAVTAAAYGKKGHHSYLFTQQVCQCISKMEAGDHLLIIDIEENQKFSPQVTVSYGFDPLLKLCSSQNRVTGKIILPSAVAQINDREKSLYLFFWGRGQLLGPFDCTTLKTLSYLLYQPSAILAEIQQKPEERRFLLKKRKRWLREQKFKKKPKDETNDPG